MCAQFDFVIFVVRERTKYYKAVELDIAFVLYM